MDICTSSQDMIQCDLCKTDLVQMYCDTCFVNLCTTCVGKHFSADFSIPHQLVKFSDKNSTLHYPVCSSHAESQCDSFCKNCNRPLCLKCVISDDSHRDHQLSLIEDIHSSKKQAIQMDLKELTEVIFPVYQYISSHIESLKNQLDEDYLCLAKKIVVHGKMMQSKTGELMIEFTDILNVMYTTHTEALSRKQQRLDQKLKNIQTALDLCEDLFYSNDIALVLKYTSLNEEYRQLPSKINASFPVFTPKTPGIEKFRGLFGNLTKLSIKAEDHGYSIQTVHESLESLSTSPYYWEVPSPGSVTIIENEYEEYVDIPFEKDIWEIAKDNSMKLLGTDQHSLVTLFSTKYDVTIPEIFISVYKSLKTLLNHSEMNDEEPMASVTSQDVVRCDLCETAVVQMYCDACFVNLCAACVGKHFSSDFSKSHQIVDFRDRKSTPIYPLCAYHSDEQCESFCKNCIKPLCLKCVISEDLHKDHQLSLIEDILRSKKQVIQRDLMELTEVILPTYQYIANYIKLRRDQLCNEYSYIGNAIAENELRLLEVIENIFCKFINELDEMKTTHMDALIKEKSKIDKKTKSILDSIDFCKKLIYSNDIDLAFGYTSLNEEYRQLPPIFNASFPVFTPETPTNDALRDLFGELTKLTITSNANGFCMKTAQMSEAVNETPVNLLPSLVESVTTIATNKVKYLACLDEDEIWTSATDNTINLFSVSKGSLISSIKTKSGHTPGVISVTKSGDLLYADEFENTVNIVKKDGIEKVLSLRDWRLCGFCITSTDDLLVTMNNDSERQSKVVRFSEFTEKQTIQFNDIGEPLYSFGNNKYICENKNLDICVIDSAVKAVVVVNQVGKLRFRYTGHYPVQNNQQFNPCGIIRDSASQLLIADYNNDCVHIIDQDGHFLRYIDSMLSKPRGLCIDTHDNVFVVQEGVVKQKEKMMCTIL